MENIELHIFTNCTMEISERPTIFDTYESWREIFGEIKPHTIWYDKNPNKDENMCDEYYNELKTSFPDTNIEFTTGLADGYIKAVSRSESKFMFMLEHDWLFDKEVVDKPLDRILKEMNKSNLMHLCFSAFTTNDAKLNNGNKISPTWMMTKQINGEFITYCPRKGLTNQPHIIQREIYVEKALKFLKANKKRKEGYGVEQMLTRQPSLSGNVFGGLQSKAAIKHLHGRGNHLKLKWKQGLI